MKAIILQLLNLFRLTKIEAILPSSTNSMVGAGVIHKGKRYITHSDLPHEHSAIRTTHTWQLVLILAVFFYLVGSMAIAPRPTAVVFVAVITIIYFLDVIFNLILTVKSLNLSPELAYSESELMALKPKKLPLYTILCPLYRESEVLPDFVANISKLEWPKNKLEVLLLLEEDDHKTIETARSLNLPKYFRILVVPHSYPKTKPKACNYGLAHAKGEFLVIYDAEDKPEPFQLKKAFLGFDSSHEKIACLQAKLNYFNPNHNLLTRLFTAEYSLWFDMILPGLQSIATSIPLGGTSNHFRTKLLKDLKGWDAFNVTEDADLGTRLFKLGYRTAIIDSITLEEANSHLGNWLRQRSRWIKGYIQTFLVHNRHPLRFARNHGIHSLIFQLQMGGKIAFMLINPILWIITISYFALYQVVGPTIESLYPPVIFYMAVFSLVVGNFLFLYYYMVGCAKHGHWNLIKYVYLVPFYWLMISVAAVKAFYQLVFRPHYWEKTNHGLHLQVKKAIAVDEMVTTTRGGSFGARFILNLTDNNWSGGAALVAVSILANFLNFLYNAYLGTHVSLEQFGLISLFGSFLYITQIPFSAFSRAVTRIAGLAFGRSGRPERVIWSTFRRWSLITSIIFSLLWLALTPLFHLIFKSGDLNSFLIFTPIWIIGLISSVDSGYLSGSQKFGILALATLVEAGMKLLTTVFLVSLGYHNLVYVALPWSMLVSFLICWYAAARISSGQTTEHTEKVVFPIKFTLTGIMNRLSNIVFLGLDVVLAKLILNPEDAGKFAMISLVGKMVYFFGSISNQFVTPLVSREEGARRNPARLFHKILLATILTTGVGFVGVGLLGTLSLPLVFGSRAVAITSFLPFYILGISAYTIANTIIVYHQTRNRFIVPVVSFLSTIPLVWFLFQVPGNLTNFVFVYGFMGIIQLFVAGLSHRLTRYSTTIVQNTFALFDLFRKQREMSFGYRGRIRFLIMNWRDIRHVWAGGAEVYVHELARHLVKEGHSVTVFCGNDGKSPDREVIDGVEIIRRGGFFTVYFWAAIYYLLKFHDSFDIIIDSENGIPFLTPLYTRRPKFLLVHHIHRDFFKDNLKFPLLQLATFIEAYLMPVAYHNSKVITVSDSTRLDLLKLGIFKQKNVTVVNPGVQVLPPSKRVTKTTVPSLLYLGRLKAYKNVDIAIRAFVQVLKKFPQAVFHIAGEGECLLDLKELVKSLDIERSVNFHGKVDERTKARLYQKSWLMVQPSSFEGWGITVIEANLYGTPVVASNIHGLSDSVVDGETGILVPPKDTPQLAKTIIRLFKNPKLRAKLGTAAQKRAGNYDWADNAKVFLAMVYRMADKRNLASLNPTFVNND